jgi:hypothetical protein
MQDCYAVQVIGSQVERQQDDNACLAYWLANMVTLLYLLHRNIWPATGGSGSSKRMAAAASGPIMGGLFDKRTNAGEQKMLCPCAD